MRNPLERRILETIANSVIREIFTNGAQSGIDRMIQHQLMKTVPGYIDMTTKNQTHMVEEAKDFIRGMVGL